MASYEVLVTDEVGVPYTEITNLCNVERIVHALNTPKLAEISLLTTEPACLDVVGPNGSYRWKRYLQIWRHSGIGRTIRFFGPIVSARMEGARTIVAAFDPLQIFVQGRFFGPTPSIDDFGYQVAQAVPGSSVARDFPDGRAGWTASGCTPSVVADTRAEGTDSVKLVATSSGDFFDEYTYDYTSGGPGVAAGYLTFYLKAWVRIDDLVEPAWEERGLYGQCQYPIGTLYDEQWAVITAKTPVATAGANSDGWYRLETAIKVPTGPVPITSRIKTRFYAVHGTDRWDAANWFLTRSVGSNGGEIIDHSTIIERVIDYGAGLTAQAQNLGKSDLGWDVDIDTCGRTSSHCYDLASNQNIWEALDSDYVRTDLYDFALEPKADGSGWTFRGYSPRKSTAHSGIALELGANVVGLPRYDCDGTKATNKPRVLGRGTGPSRELCEAFDSSVFDGLTLESVETMAADAELAALQPRAEALLSMGSAAGQVPTLRTKAGIGTDLLDAGVADGDTVPVIINYGWVRESTPRRITRLVEYPNDVLDIDTVAE